MDVTKSFNPERYKHWINDHVRFSDLDPLGHVNNNAVGQYFENARAALYQEITPQWPYGEHVLVLARTAIDFRRELHMPAALRIATGVIRVGRTSVTLANALFQGEEGVAYCESVSVLINNKTRKPVELSPDMRALFAKYMMEEAG